MATATKKKIKGGEYLIKETEASDIFIPEEFNEEQKKFLLSGIEKTKLDKFIEKLYDINLDSLV